MIWAPTPAPKLTPPVTVTPAVLLVRLRDVLLSDTSPLKVMAPPVLMLAPRLTTPEPTPVLLGLSTKALVPVPFKAELMVMCR